MKITVIELIVLGFIVCVLIAFFNYQAEAQTIIRTGNDVTLKPANSDFSIKFKGKYGAAPLSWYRGTTLVTAEFPGEGVQAVFDSGQDGTQSTANGMDEYPISQIGKPETWKYSYYGYEEFAGMDGGQATYRTQNFLPYFWASLDWTDDSIPSDPRGDHKWSLQYHDILNLGTTGYENWGVPVYFAGSSAVGSGILLIGDEIKPLHGPTNWWQRVNKIPAGRFALKITIGMLNAANDAIAGILLRKNPVLNAQADINTVYSSPGQQLNINRFGTVQMISNGVAIWTDPAQYWPANKVQLDMNDLQIEIRTHNWAPETMEIYIEGRLAGLVAAPIFGEIFGLFGSGTSGYIRYASRNFIDVGTRLQQEWRTTNRGTIKGWNKIYRVAEPLNIDLYRVNLPVAFVAGPYRQDYRIWDTDGHEYGPSGIAQNFPEGYIRFIVGAWQLKAIWAGSGDKQHGVFIVPTVTPGTPGHMVLSPAVIGLSTLPFSANTSPVPVNSTYLEVEVAPRVREDLLQ